MICCTGVVAGRPATRTRARSSESVTSPNCPAPIPDDGDRHAPLRHPPGHLADGGAPVDDQRLPLDQLVDAAVGRDVGAAATRRHGLGQEPCPAAGREGRSGQRGGDPGHRGRPRPRPRADRSTAPSAWPRSRRRHRVRGSRRVRPAPGGRRSTAGCTRPATTTKTSSVGLVKASWMSAPSVEPLDPRAPGDLVERVGTERVEGRVLGQESREIGHLHAGHAATTPTGHGPGQPDSRTGIASKPRSTRVGRRRGGPSIVRSGNRSNSARSPISPSTRASRAPRQ